ncbi:hypothetical protein [Nocardia wallacei]|uniref:hypothetical protein n=1 Tax=Nocardia wallacei TaxID=480035 RepID=UPI002455BDDD|nr:hypothetical protein [Nocardia wallacei]
MSSGQLRRDAQTFPDMNRRAERRRYRRAVARARRFAERMDNTPFNRGGYIRPAETIRLKLATDECVVAKRDGEWRCYRDDPGHVATARHRSFPFALNLFDGPYTYNGGEADLTGLMGAIRHQIARQNPWARRTFCTPVEAAERIGRALFDTYTDTLLDDLVDEWHTRGGGPGLELHEFLGMSRGEYARWVECRMPADERAAWAKRRADAGRPR